MTRENIILRLRQQRNSHLRQVEELKTADKPDQIAILWFEELAQVMNEAADIIEYGEDE